MMIVILKRDSLLVIKQPGNGYLGSGDMLFIFIWLSALTTISSLTLNVRTPSYLSLIRPISWCMRRQDISAYGIDCVE